MMRFGIILRRRPDEGHWPIANTNAKLNAAILALSAERKAWAARKGRRRQRLGAGIRNALKGWPPRY